MDIHESDNTFLYKSYEAALYASDRLNWNRICCYKDGEPLTREEIAERIASVLGYNK